MEFLILAALSLFYVLSVFAFVRVIREQNNQLKRDRASHKQTVTELIDRLMHKEGVTWTPPPKVVREDDDEIDEDTKRAIEGWKEV